MYVLLVSPAPQISLRVALRSAVVNIQAGLGQVHRMFQIFMFQIASGLKIYLYQLQLDSWSPKCWFKCRTSHEGSHKVTPTLDIYR